MIADNACSYSAEPFQMLTLMIVSPTTPGRENSSQPAHCSLQSRPNSDMISHTHSEMSQQL